MVSARGRKEHDPDQAEGCADGAVQRLDKWLWFARVIKSRTQAQGLVTDGKVRINRQRVEKPSATLHAGDVVTVTVRGHVRVLKVLAPGERRGPASEAAGLYQDLTPVSASAGTAASPAGPASGDGGAPDAATALGRGSVGRRDPGSGRPTKRDRRQLSKLTDDDPY